MQYSLNEYNSILEHSVIDIRIGTNKLDLSDYWLCEWNEKHCLVLFRMVKMTVKNSQKCRCVHIWVNSQNRQLTGFDLYSNFQLKCLNSRRVYMNFHHNCCSRFEQITINDYRSYVFLATFCVNLT